MDKLKQYVIGIRQLTLKTFPRIFCLTILLSKYHFESKKKILQKFVFDFENKKNLRRLIWFIFILFFQKFGSSGLTTDHHHIPPGGAYPHSSLLPCPVGERHDALEGGEIDPESQPKSSQYLNPNCVLLSYFSGDTATVVDEHFTRALSQPSSFNLDRNFSSSSFSIKSKAGKYPFQIIITWLYIC